jgi:peptide methionine sulfoxide reductase msrA/msrB
MIGAALLAVPGEAKPKMEKATFAGGCFWCMQPPFAHLSGVSAVVSGYTGGKGADPNYGDYAEKGHMEAVEILFDPAVITYQQLLDIFWRNIDPTDAGGQFVDRGAQYGTAIFYHSAAQKKQAEASKAELERSKKFDKPIVTRILPASVFTRAEEYHQDFKAKSPFRYNLYRMNSGRDKFIKQAWKDEKIHCRLVKKAKKC